MKDILKKSLNKSLSYKQYRELVEELVVKKSTTGDLKSESLVAYTKLNDRRMRRWDKTLKVANKLKEKFLKLDQEITWLVITESWCGDAAHLIPVMYKIAELNPKINLKLVLRDENEDLMNLFLTNGSRSIPMLIAVENKTGDVLNTYGPRPSKATDMVNEYKELHGKLSPEFKEDLQRWYNTDKGQTTFEDLSIILDFALA